MLATVRLKLLRRDWGAEDVTGRTQSLGAIGGGTGGGSLFGGAGGRLAMKWSSSCCWCRVKSCE